MHEQSPCGWSMSLVTAPALRTRRASAVCLLTEHRKLVAPIFRSFDDDDSAVVALNRQHFDGRRSTARAHQLLSHNVEMARHVPPLLGAALDASWRVCIWLSGLKSGHRRDAHPGIGCWRSGGRLQPVSLSAENWLLLRGWRWRTAAAGQRPCDIPTEANER